MISLLSHSIEKILSILTKDNYKILKFSMVGVSSIIVQFIFYNIFIITLKISPVIAVILADQIAIVSSFVLHNKFTYKLNTIKKLSKLTAAFISFYLLVIVSTFIQAGIVYLGVSFIGKSFVLNNLYLLIGIIIGFFWNYLTQNYLVWKTHKNSH